MRGDITTRIIEHDVFVFQSTPLHEGRPVMPNVCTMPKLFQSTPLHEGRQLEDNTMQTLPSQVSLR
jgi:hypothetical protein